jgi:glycosyltransferase involved in cell wall biosynthesis
VVTISREETVFLRNFGVDTLYFPYYPVKDIRERMMDICEKRKVTEKEDFLLIGTAHNPPTMKGMEQIISQWSSINKALEGARLLVAGYGSEPLKELCDGQRVVFKGTLSDEDLDRILMRIKGCIAYQEDGSGALTKISEFLLAGIPVVANSHAARSYYDVPGVVEFAHVNDLGRALKTVYATTMTVRALAPPDSSFLAGRIKALRGAEGAVKTDRLRQTAEAMAPASASATGLDASVSWELMSKSAQCDALQAELDAIKSHRNELLNSLSWRVTSPVRYIAKFLMKSHVNR